jgi:hypothetical protein
VIAACFDVMVCAFIQMGAEETHRGLIWIGNAVPGSNRGSSE